MDTKKKKNKEEFLGGYKSNRPLTILFGLIIAFGLIFAFELSIMKGDILVKYQGLLMKDSSDGATWCAAEVKKPIYAEDDRYTFYALGGSTMGEIMISNDVVNDAVSTAYGESFGFVNLSFFNMKLSNMIAIIDNIPEDSGAVIVGINAYSASFHNGYFSPKLLKSKDYKKYINASQYLRDTHDDYRHYYNFVSSEFARLLLNKLTATAIRSVQWSEREYHVYNQRVNETLEDQIAMEYVNQYQYTQADIDEFSYLLNLVIEKAHERDLEVILMFMPYDFARVPGIREDETTLLNRVIAATREAEGKSDMLFDFAYDLDLVETDFFDLRHVNNDQARMVFQNEFINQIGNFLDGIE